MRHRRAGALDPLLPRHRPLPAPAPGDIPLRVPGAEGLLRRHRPAPESFDASWHAAEQYQLHACPDPRLPEPARTAALGALLAAWHHALPPLGHDSEAVFTWPSRDAALTPLLLAHGMVPKRIAAVRPARRPLPAPRTGPRTLIRPFDPAWAAEAAALWLDGMRWDAQFGSCVIRPSTAAHIRLRLARSLVWVAERQRRVVGLLAAEDPRGARAGRTGYISSLLVAAPHRGDGIGSALVRTAHAALDEAGCSVTLLHYAALSPVSGPFWHRHGYRPLWTTWVRRGPLGPATPGSSAPASAPPAPPTPPAARPA
ncbi:GNAT family N-acetyltransferase [Streptomyces sp. MS19]|uniref:GNAT family N-acetyltransferase n=1 Tax=Streptomyces sp. MS19 TaxID=3385972 RepID=UPI0039A268DE